MESVKAYLFLGKKRKQVADEKASAAATTHTNYPPSNENVQSPAAGGLRISGRAPDGSRPASIFPEGDFRNTGRECILDIKSDVMASHLYSQQQERLWTVGNASEGVVLKKSRNNYTAHPKTLEAESGGFFDAVVALNVKVSHFVEGRQLSSYKLMISVRYDR